MLVWRGIIKTFSFIIFSIVLVATLNADFVREFNRKKYAISKKIDKSEQVIEIIELVRWLKDNRDNAEFIALRYSPEWNWNSKVLCFICDSLGKDVVIDDVLLIDLLIAIQELSENFDNFDITALGYLTRGKSLYVKSIDETFKATIDSLLDFCASRIKSGDIGLDARGDVEDDDLVRRLSVLITRMKLIPIYYRAYMRDPVGEGVVAKIARNRYFGLLRELDKEAREVIPLVRRIIALAEGRNEAMEIILRDLMGLNDIVARIVEGVEDFT